MSCYPLRQTRGSAPDGVVTLPPQRIQAFSGCLNNLWSCVFRAPAIKGRFGRILESQLHRLSEFHAGDLRHDRKSHVDARRYSTSGNHVAIAYNPLGASFDAKLS
jgi:hypothetical protein